MKRRFYWILLRVNRLISPCQQNLKITLDRSCSSEKPTKRPEKTGSSSFRVGKG